MLQRKSQRAQCKLAYKLPSAAFLLQRKCQRAQCKLAFKLPSAAFLLQRYAFLLKDAKILGKNV